MSFNNSKLMSVDVPIGRESIVMETGKLAKQADGSILAHYGQTSVLTTCVMAKAASLTCDFFPLQVHYQEKYYAIGKIPGGFIKKEGRIRDKEILASRLIDRSLRPLFMDGLRHETQIMAMIISADQINSPDIIAINAASMALCLSDIPFNGPVAAVRIGYLDAQYIINPTFEEIEKGSLDLVVSGNKNKIIMLEGGAKELEEGVIIDAIEFAQPFIQKIIAGQEELVRQCGKEKRTINSVQIDIKLRDQIRQESLDKMKSIFLSCKSKLELNVDLEELKNKLNERFLQELGEDVKSQISNIFSQMEEDILKQIVLKEKRRIDGRSMDEIRSIDCEVGVLKRTHGSALFTRGETQSLSVITLGTSLDVQRFDDLDGEGSKRFMLHYSFLPFCVGEVGRIGMPSRREIGHGSLAEKAIFSVLPEEEQFPYTIRLVTDILESNGSSSMATVCGGVLALLDAGIPISNSVSGIAMGLVSSDEEYEILTDIQGLEDKLGDMDFKVTGTRDGITALQMDLKIDGITIDIITNTLRKAHSARFRILDKMDTIIRQSRKELSEYAPKIILMNIDPSKNKDIIGPLGKTIRKIEDDTGAGVCIDDNGKITISAKEEEMAIAAYDIIKQICSSQVEVGKIYDGTVTRIIDIGAFVEIAPGKEGLCHISKLGNRRVNKVTDILKEGEKVRVKCLDIDQRGRINLSIRDARPSEQSTRPVRR